jgi:hypothetical protein
MRAVRREAGSASDGSLRREASTCSMSLRAPSMSTRMACSARCGDRAITASSTARCSGSESARADGREFEISKLVRSSAESALLICASMRLCDARINPWWKRRSLVL